MRRALLFMAVVTLAAGSFVNTAGAGAPLPTTVSIRVELDLPYQEGSDGPVVFEVTDAPVGAGPELTGADMVDNPSDWCGSLNVDVDNVAGTITVTPDEVCDFQTALVVVTGQGIDSIQTVTNDLWETIDEGPEDECTGVTMALATSASEGEATIDWDSGVDCEPWMLEDGIAVFSYTQGPPTTPTTTPTTEAPTTSSTAGTQPAAVAPRFTG
jgi:hypothetical protein